MDLTFLLEWMCPCVPRYLYTSNEKNTMIKKPTKEIYKIDDTKPYQAVCIEPQLPFEVDTQDNRSDTSLDSWDRLSDESSEYIEGV